MEYYEWKIKIPKKPLQLIKFRISTIMLLTAIVALALAWRRDHNKLASIVAPKQNMTGSWGINQVTGPPDTPGSGDIATAWASASQDDSSEWLELEYDESVVPTAILVHESYNPGALTKITHVSFWGYETTLWEGADPTPVTAGRGVSRVPVSADFKTGHIKLYFDSPKVPGWNEIDAVGIEHGNNQVIWAKSAKASSVWGSAPDYRYSNGYMSVY
jgi:hypothetical protein